MDAQKIEYVCGDQQQAVHFAPLPVIFKAGMQSFHRLRGLVGRNRPEAYQLRTVGAGFRNFIVGRFPPSALLGDELIQVPVKLQNYADSERYIDMIGMDGNQNITVAGNLLF